MSIRVERAAYDPESGFLYYVIFKPTLEVGMEEVLTADEVEVAVSLTENGDLADMTFQVPPALRTALAMSYICGDARGSYVEPHLFIAIPGRSGDAVVAVSGKLELDLAGRIVGMVVQWQPTEGGSA